MTRRLAQLLMFILYSFGIIVLLPHRTLLADERDEIVLPNELAPYNGWLYKCDNTSIIHGLLAYRNGGPTTTEPETYGRLFYYISDKSGVFQFLYVERDDKDIKSYHGVPDTNVFFPIAELANTTIYLTPSAPPNTIDVDNNFLNRIELVIWQFDVNGSKKLQESNCQRSTP
jgi:hypothetical protein